MRMAGRTGNERVTTKNLKIVKILPEKNIIFVKGSVPGAINSIVEINK
jgi:large subunit ribosomal protein L3